MKLFNTCFLIISKDIDEETICKLLKISKPTLQRWKNGESSPHPLGYQSIFEVLLEYKNETKEKESGS